MKALLVFLMLTASVSAGPLSWLTGTYHSSLDSMEEAWVETGDGDLLGTTVWLEQGAVVLRELARIHRLKNDLYQLDLWLTFTDGSGKSLKMTGSLEKPERLTFRSGSDRLTYCREGTAGLKVELQKKELRVFDLQSGPIAEAPLPLQGDYVLHTYLGSSVFADELRWTSAQSGTLTVSGKFSAALENISSHPQRLVTFEIPVKEGHQNYRVRYQMHFNADLSQATGTLENVSSGHFMGSFVALKKP